MKIYAVKILDISEENLNKLKLTFDLEKKCKIEKFINKKDKIRTLIWKILIRTIIIQELNISNNHISFKKNQYGKPYMEYYPKFNFNISHSGNIVLCGIDNKPIGIDVEEVKHIEYRDIAKSFFTEMEFDYINRNNSNIRLSKFYEIWTLKESYIKCCGQGLSIPLKSFSIDIDKYENIKVSADNQYNEYIFKKFDINLNYKIAVCSLNKEISDDIIMIDQNRLINIYFKIISN
ncbi:4'-phosphopantetheinyl transferase family protein [Clostridium hydrogenum]|uniref:4'-phosphopantetheinyl transferase family protein n=1 Tax=Clostridium hydrogenum TaxID=2855764 RepID=UPI001F28988F|nr:4'-phosphopantetheinyl transferase superfamily protein [Clostridium hydrogenum]